MHRRGRQQEEELPPPNPQEVARGEAQSTLDSLLEAGDDLVSADFIDENLNTLSYSEDTGSNIRSGSSGALGVSRSRSSSRSARRGFRRQSTELRERFNDPKRRLADRASLHRGSSGNTVSGLFEQSATRRRRASNSGGLSSADVLGL